MSETPGCRAPHCREVEELLPWLANGSLEAVERARVEAHLDACPDCRAELERCEAERAAVQAAHGVAPAPHPAQLARLFERVERVERGELDDEEPDDATARPAARSLFARTPPAVRWVMAAQLAAIALLGHFAARPEPSPESRSPGPFRTLSSPDADPSPARLRAVFAPEATEAEIRALLLDAGVEIVAGPSPLGAYSLAPHARPERNPLRDALATLRADPRVRFAEPIAGATGRDVPRP